MSKLGPVPRRELIRRLKDLGFAGPYPGSGHEYMVREGVYVTIPNPHGGDIGVKLLNIVLKQAGISREEWLSD